LMMTIDEEALPEIVVEIRKALASGEVRAWAHTPNDPVPRELPSETWAVYQLAIEERDRLLFIVPFGCSGPPGDEPVLLDLLLSREDVLRRWPDAEASKPPRKVGTIASENACRLWLVKLMKTNPDKPRPKEAMRHEAKERFPELGKRGFDRAWAAAIGQ
jgi:glycine/D-amino acid oxidase-like deaminating enzyme